MTKADTDNALLRGKNRLRLTIDSFLFTFEHGRQLSFSKENLSKEFFFLLNHLCYIYEKQFPDYKRVCLEYLLQLHVDMTFVL